MVLRPELRSMRVRGDEKITEAGSAAGDIDF
jgi:hypothetical protein